MKSLQHQQDRQQQNKLYQDYYSSLLRWISRLKEWLLKYQTQDILQLSEKTENHSQADRQ